MTNFQITINDLTLTPPPVVVTKIEIEVIELVLNSHVTVVARLLNSNGNLIDNRIFKIVGDEYNAWGDDDNYITNLILTKLGASQTV